MPGKFTHKSGANIAGHADKWSNDQRAANSHDAGQGSRGSRNQGTGQAGKDNTAASHGTNTNDMKYNDKLKYFNQLGLLGDNKPTPQLKDFPDLLRSTFKEEPQYLKDISQALKAIPRDQYQSKVQQALEAFYSTEQQSDDVYDLYASVMQVLS